MSTVTHEYVCYLDAPPSSNHIFKTIRTRNGKLGRAKTNDYTSWLTAQMYKNKMRLMPLPECYQVRLLIQRKSKLRDLDNYIKPVLDFLVKQGVMSDDRFVMDVQARYTEVHKEHGDIHCIVYGGMPKV